MRYFAWILIFSVIVGAGCTALQQRVALRKVRFRLEGVSFTGLSLQGVTFRLHWKAVNPNAVKAVLDGFEMDLYANERLLTHLTHHERVEIPARDSTTFTVSVPLTWSALGQSVTQAVRRRHLEVKVEGRALVHTPLGDLRVPVLQKTRRIL